MLTNRTIELASVQTRLEILGDVFVRANLMSSSTFSLFLDFVLIRTRIENPASKRQIESKGRRQRKGSIVKLG